MIVRLPTGLLEGGDLFNFVELDELRGSDQNVLANVEMTQATLTHIPKLLEKRVIQLQTEKGIKYQGDLKAALYKLPANDVTLILVKLREKTYGEKYYFEAVCPHCEHKGKNYFLDLSVLECEYHSAEQILQPKVITLPKLKVELELKPLYLNDLFEVASMATDKKKMQNIITDTLLVTVKRFGEESNKSKIKELILDMPASDLTYVASQLEQIKLEGSIDTTITNECQNCSKEFDTQLPVYDVGFFDHTRASMS